MNYQKIKDCHAGIFDGDYTLWNARMATEIGKKYLIKELKSAHLGTFLSGIRGALDVNRTVKNDLEHGEARGLSKFYDVLSKNGLGDEQEIYNFAKAIMEKKQVRGARRFASLYDKHIFLATLGGSTATKAAKDYFMFTDFISNKDVFDRGGHLVEVELVILDGTDKLKAVEDMLSKYGLEIEDCFFVGDSRNDMKCLEAAKVPCASPYVEKSVKDFIEENNGVQIEKTYGELSF